MKHSRLLKGFFWPLAAVVAVGLGTLAYTASRNDKAPCGAAAAQCELKAQCDAEARAQCESMAQCDDKTSCGAAVAQCELKAQCESGKQCDPDAAARCESMAQCDDKTPHCAAASATGGLCCASQKDAGHAGELAGEADCESACASKAEEHAGHDHGAEEVAADEHAGHDHGAGEAHVDEVTLTPEAIARNGIRLEPARKQALAEFYTVPGRVSYNTEAMAHIGTPVEGRVAELHVKLGDMAAAGAPLLAIDSPSLGEAQSAYLQARAAVEVARAALEVSAAAAQRAKRLHEGQGISLGEFQKREGEHRAAQGALRLAESALTAAENRLRVYGMTAAELARLAETGAVSPRYVVRAPLAGRVVRREVTLGEVVGPDRDALLTLADMTVLWVLADVPENRIRQIAPGSAATVTVEALGGRSFPGKVAYIAPELNRETRTAQVRIEIEDGQSPIKPGMFAQAQLRLSDGANAPGGETLVVPEAAVQRFEGRPAVFVAVAGEPGAFAARPVEIGPAVGRQAPVLSGLKDGEQVVVEGAFVIKAELAKGIMEGKTCSGH